MITSLAVQMGAYESMYERAVQEEDPDNTLFLQLTIADVVLVWMGLALIERVYGTELVKATQDKLTEVIEEQEFFEKPSGRDEE